VLKITVGIEYAVAYNIGTKYHPPRLKIIIIIIFNLHGIIIDRIHTTKIIMDQSKNCS